jgi:glycosyltransferase involved in cell wall biosynthesis
MKISIITPTYNSEKYLRDCLESIKKQTYNNIEHIICDNISTDNTKKISANYSNIFIEKRDHSMYEALNTGILNSSGDILCFLNSDDLYPNNTTIERVINYFKANKDCQIIYGRCIRADKDLRYIYTHMPKKNITLEFAKQRIFIISHPAVFIKRNIFERYGLYDLRLKYMADCEYWIRLLYKNVKFKYYDEILAVFRRHDSNLSISKKAIEEVRYIANKYGYNNSPTQVRTYLLYDNMFNVNYLCFLINKYLIKRIIKSK